MTTSNLKAWWRVLRGSDALNRIGNQVFALGVHNRDNYVATSAPVHFPRIWDASWFTWVQYGRIHRSTDGQKTLAKRWA